MKSVLSLWRRLLSRAYGLAESQARLQILAKTYRSRSPDWEIKYPAQRVSVVQITTAQPTT